MTELIRTIREWINNKKCGKIIINFFKGGIASYELRETFKPEDQK